MIAVVTDYYIVCLNGKMARALPGMSPSFMVNAKDFHAVL